MVIKLVASVLAGGNQDVLVGFSRKQSLRQETPHALLLLYWGAEVRAGGGREGRGGQDEDVAKLTTAECSPWLHLGGQNAFEVGILSRVKVERGF